MKRILCIILAVLLLIPSAYAAGENMTLTISQVQGEVGDTVTITGQVTNAPACTSFRVILTYDSACLKITGGSIGPKVKGGYINTTASFGGKKAISALSADATKSFEGNVVLFTLTAEIVGTPASGDNTALTIAHYEFFDTSANLQKVTPGTVTDGSLTYPSLQQPAGGGNDNTGSGDNNTGSGDNNNNNPGDNNTGNNNTGSGDNNNNNTGDNNTGNNNTGSGDNNNNNTGDNNTNTGDNNTNTGDNNTNTGDNNTNTGDNNTNTGDNNTNTGDNNTNTGDNNTNTGDNNTGAGEGNTGSNESTGTPDAPATGNDQKPSTDNKNDKTPTGDWIVVEDQFAHIDEDGNSNLYEGEYEEPENPGDKADVILKDEDGNTVGSVVIEKDEAGNLNVIEQDLNPKKPVWPWVAGGVALVLAAAAVAVVLILKKKKETVSDDASYIP